MREVTDLYLTALLRLRGHQPVRVRTDGRRTVWVFEATPELEADLSGYFEGSLQLSALAFAEAIRTTKGEAMNRLRQEVPMR